MDRIDPFGEHALIPWGLQNPGLWRGKFAGWPLWANGGGLTAFDVCGYAYHGTLNNIPYATAWQAFRHGHYGLAFGGSASDDDVSVNSSSAGLARQSMEAWVTCDNVTGGTLDSATVYMELYDTSSFSLRLYIESSTVRAQWRDGTPGTTVTVQGGTTVSNGELLHIVATFDSVNNDHRIYLNGNLDGTSTTSVNAIGSTWASANIGAHVQSANTLREFLGTIHEVNLYDRVLPATEVRQLSSDVGVAYERRLTDLVWADQPAAGGVTIKQGLHRINNGMVRSLHAITEGAA